MYRPFLKRSGLITFWLRTLSLEPMISRDHLLDLQNWPMKFFIYSNDKRCRCNNWHYWPTSEIHCLIGQPMRIIVTSFIEANRDVTTAIIGLFLSKRQLLYDYIYCRSWYSVCFDVYVQLLVWILKLFFLNIKYLFSIIV